jgi:hypothetical protein
MQVESIMFRKGLLNLKNGRVVLYSVCGLIPKNVKEFNFYEILILCKEDVKI